MPSKSVAAVSTVHKLQLLPTGKFISKLFSWKSLHQPNGEKIRVCVCLCAHVHSHAPG